MEGGGWDWWGSGLLRECNINVFNVIVIILNLGTIPYGFHHADYRK